MLTQYAFNQSNLSLKSGRLPTDFGGALLGLLIFDSRIIDEGKLETLHMESGLKQRQRPSGTWSRVLLFGVLYAKTFIDLGARLDKC